MYVEHNTFMKLSFVNRAAEFKELDAAARLGGLIVLYGRRRVGKTRLLVHWLGRRAACIARPSKAPPPCRSNKSIATWSRGWQPLLRRSLGGNCSNYCDCKARSAGFSAWMSFLILPTPTLRCRACCSAGSITINHPVVSSSCAGSSTRMMNDLFLNRSAPLYGRARKLIQVEPMSYAAFCRASKLKASDPQSFTRFALVGGIPHYWEYVQPQQSLLELADSLYFGLAPYMEDEPARILRDEGFAGLNALSVLEAIGRGAAKPSEIAARLGTAQTNLSRLFQQLRDVSLLERELPFGESVRLPNACSIASKIRPCAFGFKSTRRTAAAGEGIARSRS